MKDERKFKEFMIVLFELFDKPMSEMLMSIYWKTLEPFTDAECQKAFETVIATARFFPKPVDFIEALQGKEEDRAARAWLLVAHAIRRVGNYKSVKFVDPAIHSVIQDMGGWVKLCDTLEKDMTWRQREFENLYSILGHEGKHPEYLCGTIELQNSANGYDVKLEIAQVGFETGQKQITSKTEPGE